MSVPPSSVAEENAPTESFEHDSTLQNDIDENVTLDQFNAATDDPSILGQSSTTPTTSTSISFERLAEIRRTIFRSSDNGAPPVYSQIDPSRVTRQNPNPDLETDQPGLDWRLRPVKVHIAPGANTRVVETIDEDFSNPVSFNVNFTNMTKILFRNI